MSKKLKPGLISEALAKAIREGQGKSIPAIKKLIRRNKGKTK